jgi:hypothetical protein
VVDDIDRIMSFIGETPRDSFVNDEKTVFAVCYAFTRPGEAVEKIPVEVRNLHPKVEWATSATFGTSWSTCTCPWTRADSSTRPRSIFSPSLRNSAMLAGKA